MFDLPVIPRLGDRPVMAAVLRDPKFDGGVNCVRRLCCVGCVGRAIVGRRTGLLAVEFHLVVAGVVRRLPLPTFDRFDLLVTWGAREVARGARELRLDDARRDGDA